MSMVPRRNTVRVMAMGKPPRPSAANSFLVELINIIHWNHF